MLSLPSARVQVEAERIRRREFPESRRAKTFTRLLRQDAVLSCGRGVAPQGVERVPGTRSWGSGGAATEAFSNGLSASGVRHRIEALRFTNAR